jgi:DNA-binding response OmpR family regulator
MPTKMMIVDDDPAALDLILALVEPLGFDVLALKDSRHAAKCATEQSYDAIFVDVQMPHIDGFELTKLIRGSRLNNGVPIVMITAHEDVETMRRGFKAGVTFFLTKPFHPQKLRGLLLALRSAISQQKKRQTRLPFYTRVTGRWGYKYAELSSVSLGESGMVLESAGEVDAGQEINLDFSLAPGQKPLSLRGKVIRKDPPDRIEVHFQTLTAEDQEAIRQYMSLHQKEQDASA